MTCDIVEDLKNGVLIIDDTVYTETPMRGRFKEEIDLDVFLKKDGDKAHLFYLKIFYGRRPYYRPWIELYGLNATIHLRNTDIDYFNSPLEMNVLQYLTNCIGAGENIFVDYYMDLETRKQLETGIPAAVSRLGFMLYRLGFTWFKDWYFPEGFMEGEQKLQAEKPLNELEKNRQLKKIYESVKTFLKKTEAVDRGNPQLSLIRNRAHQIVGQKI